MLVPLLAFDKFKNRLGYGKGYYDNYLNKYLKKKIIFRIGIAFSFQKHKKSLHIKMMSNLNYILTEKGFYNENNYTWRCCWTNWKKSN